MLLTVLYANGIHIYAYLNLWAGAYPPCISAPLRQIPSDLVYKHQNTGIVHKPIKNRLVPEHQMLRTCTGTWVGKVVTIVVLVFVFAHISMLEEYKY